MMEDLNSIDRNRKVNIEEDFMFNIVRVIADVMDKKYLDPLLGFLLPTFGDLLPALLNLPSLYVSMFRIRSVSLSLAIVFNTLLDCLLGIFPFGIGDFLDVFHRSYMKNYRLILGFVEKNQQIVNKIQRRAFYLAVAIVVLVVVIYYMIKFVVVVVHNIFDMILNGVS